MTLEDAIRKVLLEHRKEMTAIEIASVINEQKLFVRKDNKAIPPKQIELRAKESPASFHFISENKERKIELQQRGFTGKSTDYFGVFWDLSNVLNRNDAPNEILVLGILAFIMIQKNDVVKFYNPIDKLLECEDCKGMLLRDIDLFLKVRSNEYFLPWFRLKESINDANDKLILEILKTISQYEIQACKPFYDSVDSFIYSYYGIQHRSRFITSTVITRVVASLIALKKGDTIYNPAAGAGLMTANVVIKNEHIKNHVSVKMQESDSAWSNLSYFVAKLKGIKSIEIRNDNPLINPLCDEESADWVIADLILEDLENDTGNTDLLGLGPTENPISLYLQLTITRLSNEGKAIVLVPDSFLYEEAPSSKYLREYLVESDLLEAVITFPSGKFPPMLMSTSLLVISKTKSLRRKGKVLFIKAKEIWNQPDKIQRIYKDYEQLINFSRSVFLQDIAECDYHLLVNRFVTDVEEELRAAAKNSQLYPLRYLTFKHHFESFKTGDELPFVQIDDLSLSDTDNILDLNMITETSANKPFGKLIDQDAILIAKNKGKMRATLFKFKEQPIAISNEIHPFVVDSDIVLIEYLLSELNLKYARKQYAAAVKGNSSQTIRIHDLMDIKIRLQGNRSNQLKIVSEREEFVAHIKKTFQSYQEKEKGFKKQEMQILSAIKHSFAQLQGAVSSDIKNLKYFLNRKAKEKELVNWSDKISQRPGTRTIDEVFNDVNSSLEKMSKTFENIQNILDFNPAKMKKLESIYFPDFVTAEVRAFIGNRTDYKIFFDIIENGNLNIKIDKQQFSEVIRNFCHNTDEHGYEGLDIRKKMLFSFRTSLDQTRLILDLKNNGRPMPEEFSFDDFITFGSRNGDRKGSGIGGYLMNKVVENHGGTMRLITSKAFLKLDSRYSMGVHFRIELPIK